MAERPGESEDESDYPSELDILTKCHPFEEDISEDISDETSTYSIQEAFIPRANLCTPRVHCENN